jgi:uncharacterized protein with HEPN domain
MPPKRLLDADLIRVRHMLDAAREALGFVGRKNRSALEKDRMLLLAILKDLEILGEAAGRVTERFRARHPEIPWSAIIATRNRLIHGYFDVDLEVVWETVAKDLPRVAKALSGILSRSGR